MVGRGQIFVAQVGSASHLWFGLGKFHLKIPNFIIFCHLGQRKSYRSRIKKYHGQSRVGLLFTADQKYARVWSGQGPSRIYLLSQSKPIAESQCDWIIDFL